MFFGASARIHNYFCIKRRPMNLIDKILGRALEQKSVDVVPTGGSTAARARYIGEIFSDLTRPLVVGSNFMTLFRTIPEIS